MVRAHPDPPVCGWALGQRINGGVAQLGEHLLCKQGVIGSIPFTSTTSGIRGQGSGISNLGPEGWRQEGRTQGTGGMRCFVFWSFWSEAGSVVL
jgi:hypothetical protein